MWAVAWNPSQKASIPDILAVCDWNQKLSFYVLSGRQVRLWLLDACDLRHARVEVRAGDEEDDVITMGTPN